MPEASRQKSRRRDEPRSRFTRQAAGTLLERAYRCRLAERIFEPTVHPTSNISLTLYNTSLSDRGFGVIEPHSHLLYAPQHRRHVLMVRRRWHRGARCSNRARHLLLPRRYPSQPRNQRHNTLQDRAAERGDAKPETTDRQQEPQHPDLGAQLDGYMRQEWRQPLHARDREQRVHGQFGQSGEGGRLWKSCSGASECRGQGQDSRTHSNLGICSTREGQLDIYHRDISDPPTRRLQLPA